MQRKKVMWSEESRFTLGPSDGASGEEKRQMRWYKPVLWSGLEAAGSGSTRHIFTQGEKRIKRIKIYIYICIYIVYIYHYIYIIKTCAAGDAESKESEQQACFHDHDQSITRINKITEVMLLYACVNCYYLITFFSLLIWYHVSANGFREAAHCCCPSLILQACCIWSSNHIVVASDFLLYFPTCKYNGTK